VILPAGCCRWSCWSLIARTPLLDLGIQSAYATAVIATATASADFPPPALPATLLGRCGMSIGMALRPGQATAAACWPAMQQGPCWCLGRGRPAGAMRSRAKLVAFKSVSN